jgi:hypothetical protein
MPWLPGSQLRSAAQQPGWSQDPSPGTSSAPAAAVRRPPAVVPWALLAGPGRWAQIIAAPLGQTH